MKQLGDIKKINGAAVDLVEVIIGGSPCQDLSVVGKREGLSGERSGLFMEQIRIIKEMRKKSAESGTDVIIPRFMVWENVPGAFSSNKGEDFRIVLEETARVCEPSAVIPRPEKGKWTNSGAVMGNGWSIAWRVLDAQFWGVPQRRRRIALVADFGGYTAPEILFERNGLSRNTPPSPTPWKNFAAAIAKRFGGTDRQKRTISGPGPCRSTYCIQGNCIDRADTSGCNGKGWTEGVSYTLNTVDRPAVCDANANSTITAFACNQRDEVRILGDKAGALQAQPGVKQQTYIYDARGNGNGNIVPTLTGDHESRVTDYTALCVRERCGCEGGGKGLLVQNEVAGSLLAENKQFVVAIDRAAFNQGINARYDMEISEDGINSTLTARGPSAVCAAFKYKQGSKARTIAYQEEQSPCLSSEQHDISVVTVSDVRRLTPLEGERLQGYPDGWTDIGTYIDSRGKEKHSSDSARYKAIGNSIALPPWAWILERLNSYCIVHTMASLFDGIGGFPLIWETLNGKGSCLWASEIEEFPIAVTKKHFGGNK